MIFGFVFPEIFLNLLKINVTWWMMLLKVFLLLMISEIEGLYVS